jgi:hypothetical protein
MAGADCPGSFCTMALYFYLSWIYFWTISPECCCVCLGPLASPLWFTQFIFCCVPIVTTRLGKPDVVLKLLCYSRAREMPIVRSVALLSRLMWNFKLWLYKTHTLNRVIFYVQTRNLKTSNGDLIKIYMFVSMYSTDFNYPASYGAHHADDTPAPDEALILECELQSFVYLPHTSMFL